MRTAEEIALLVIDLVQQRVSDPKGRLTAMIVGAVEDSDEPQVELVLALAAAVAVIAHQLRIAGHSADALDTLRTDVRFASIVNTLELWTVTQPDQAM